VLVVPAVRENDEGGRMRTTNEADRQQARFTLLTPADVAARLDGVGADTVRSWCKAGWLQHVDFRRPGARSPSYGIAWEWAEAFVAKGGARVFVNGAVRPYWWERNVAA
jgi:hypothetical protein